MSILSRFPSGGPEAAEAARRLLRDRRRADDEQRDQHGLTGQAAYEARLASEEAKRQAERDRLHAGHVDRETERWAAIQVLRDLRAEITKERDDLTARFYNAVEHGNLSEAVECQTRLAALGAVDGAAQRRLQAHGMEK